MLSGTVSCWFRKFQKKFLILYWYFTLLIILRHFPSQWFSPHSHAVQSTAICCFSVSQRDSWCSRLASLAWASLGPAQYRRWAVIQPCIAILNFCYRYCSHPELHIFLHRALTLIRLQRIYNVWCSMLVFTPFTRCFVTLRGTFMHFPELTY
jgi:hypothetical protein